MYVWRVSGRQRRWSSLRKQVGEVYVVEEFDGAIAGGKALQRLTRRLWRLL